MEQHLQMLGVSAEGGQRFWVGGLLERVARETSCDKKDVFSAKGASPFLRNCLAPLSTYMRAFILISTRTPAHTGARH